MICAACGSDNPDGARFCNGCGPPLSPTAAAREERKVVSAVFVDLVGSTARAEESDPEDVRALLRRYHERAPRFRALRRHGGEVHRRRGRRGLRRPVAHEDDPERAVRAALAARDTIAALNEADAARDLHVRTRCDTARRWSLSARSPATVKGWSRAT